MQLVFIKSASILFTFFFKLQMGPQYIYKKLYFSPDDQAIQQHLSFLATIQTSLYTSVLSLPTFTGFHLSFHITSLPVLPSIPSSLLQVEHTAGRFTRLPLENKSPLILDTGFVYCMPHQFYKTVVFTQQTFSVLCNQQSIANSIIRAGWLNPLQFSISYSHWQTF